MPKKKPAAGFMSYVISDDKYGQLTTLRERLSDEIGMQIGTEFPIFQDRRDIHWGQSWKERIENSLDETTFLIPIITPSFFNSPACRDELSRFIEREKELKRNDLILPIYFIDTPLLNDAELRSTDELAEVIASRQNANWRELRFEPFTNPLVGKTLEKLAVQIRDALPHLQTTKTAPETKDTPSLPAGASEQPTKSRTTQQQPPIRIVDPMHRGDFSTITEAIKSVAPGTRILVRPGLYQEGMVVDKPLEIIGDGALGEIVIQATDTNALRFETTMGRIVNLTLRQMGGGRWFCVDIVQGRLELEDCDISSRSLSSVVIHGDADPRIRRNRIHDTTAGSGVYVYENAQGTIEDNEIFANSDADVSVKGPSNPTLRRNRIYGSSQVGGILIYDGGQGAFEDNDIFGSGGAGVEIRNNSNAILRRNRIHDNKEDGVYVHSNAQSTIEDNDIFGNSYSGINTTMGGRASARNNRINKNGFYGAEIYENGFGTYENNDLTENAKGAWAIDEASAANVTRTNNKDE